MPKIHFVHHGRGEGNGRSGASLRCSSCAVVRPGCTKCIIRGGARLRNRSTGVMPRSVRCPLHAHDAQSVSSACGTHPCMQQLTRIHSYPCPRDARSASSPLPAPLCLRVIFRSLFSERIGALPTPRMHGVYLLRTRPNFNCYTSASAPE